MAIWSELGAVAMCLPAWFLAGRLAQQLKLPLITGYLIAGAVSGPSLLQLFRSNGLASLGFVDHACLGVIALAAGAELRVSELKKTKRQVDQCCQSYCCTHFSSWGSFQYDIPCCRSYASLWASHYYPGYLSS